MLECLLGEKNEIEEIEIEEIEKKLKKNGIINAEPELILGWNIGESLNFDQYSDLGFHHPKMAERYSLNDPGFSSIYDGIIESGQFDDPILVYVKKDLEVSYLLVLDGATRLSVAAIARSRNPESFVRIPMKLFRGTEQEAKIEMARRNWTGHQRSMTPYEEMKFVEQLIKWGWNPSEIAQKMQRGGTFVQTIYNLKKMSESLIDEVKDLLREGKINRTCAIEASSLSQIEQKLLVDSIKKGEKINVNELKKKSINHKQINLPKRLDRLQNVVIADLAECLRSKGLDRVCEDYLFTIKESLEEIAKIIQEQNNII